jgi:hypothetical protein
VTNDDASETSSIAPTHSIESNHEPQIISLVTAFLVIHPQGADLESILSYVRKFVPTIGEGDLLDVLTKNEKLFSDENEQLWFYSVFRSMP